MVILLSYAHIMTRFELEYQSIVLPLDKCHLSIKDAAQNNL